MSPRLHSRRVSSMLRPPSQYDLEQPVQELFQ
jgi:hypothetical protein